MDKKIIFLAILFLIVLTLSGCVWVDGYGYYSHPYSDRYFNYNYDYYGYPQRDHNRYNHDGDDHHRHGSGWGYHRWR